MLGLLIGYKVVSLAIFFYFGTTLENMPRITNTYYL